MNYIRLCIRAAHARSTRHAMSKGGYTECRRVAEDDARCQILKGVILAEFMIRVLDDSTYVPVEEEGC